MKPTTKKHVGWIPFNQKLSILGLLLLLGTSKLWATYHYNVSKNEVTDKISCPVKASPPDTLMVTDVPPVISDFEDSILITPGAIFDTVFDGYGNKYPLHSLMVNSEELYLKVMYNAGFFDVTFEPGSGMDPLGTTQEAERAAVVLQVLSDISDFIDSPLLTSGERVNIWVRDLSQIVSSPSTSGVLGLASSFYVLPGGAPTVGGIADNQIWRTIITGEDAYTGVVSPLISSNTNPGVPANYFHGMMAFNFSNTAINWHTDMSTTNPSGYFDLYSVILHEITHALGFASLINDDGTSKFGANYNYYSRYDLFLENQSGVSLIEGTFSGCSLYDFEFNSILTPANVITPPNTAPNTCVTNQTACGNAVVYSGGITVPVYTPNCFESASTLSHFEDQCFPSGSPHGNDVYFNMSNAQNTGANKRFLKDEEATVLCDLGYTLNATYGNNTNVSGSFKNYGASCTGLEVGGVNDGITAGGGYTFSGATSTSVSIAGILSNDYNADAFECLQVILGGGSTNFTSGTAATALTYTSSTPGLKLLRYIPYNTTSGKRGNITYILVYVTDASCTASACDLVNNGGFESVISGCGLFGGTNPTTLSCWDLLSLTPDVFVRGCTDYMGLFNTGTSTWYSSPASNTYSGTPNDDFMGVWSSQYTTHYMSEASQTLLNSPLIPTEQYVLSFWGKVNNWTNVSAPVSFTSYPNISAPIWILNQNITSMIPNSVMLASPITIPNDNSWHYFTVPFTFSGTTNHNALAICMEYLGASAPNDGAYLFIDNVSIQPLSEAVLFDLPVSICTAESISDLSTYITPPAFDGEFTGAGVSESGGIYSFDGATAGVGTHMITYTYETTLGCTLTVYGFIDVTATCFCSGDVITDFDWSNTFSLSPLNTYELNSDVDVTGNNVVLTDAIITIAPNVIITVENGASLTLDHSHLYTCGDMWGGIVVEPGGQLTIINNSMIEDAQYAIDIQNHTATTPILTIEESIFNRNYINVNIVNYQEITGTYPFEVQNSVFTSRDIVFTPTTWPTVADLTTLANSGDLDEHYEVGNYTPSLLKSPLDIYPSGAAFFLDNVGILNGGTFYGIEIDGDDGTGTFNLFDEMFYGVFANNSNLTSRNNVYQYMNEFALGLGSGIKAENFNIGSDEYKIVVEEENHFYDCPTGIELIGYNDIEIDNTNMRSTQMPVSSLPDEGELGIFVETPYLTKMDITGNTITNVRNGIVFLGEVDGGAPTNQGQKIGPVNITENIIQATLDGNSGTPTNEYVLNGIIADNVNFYVGQQHTVYSPINVSNNKLYQVHNGIHTQNWLNLTFSLIGWFNRVHDIGNYISLRQRTYPSATNQQQYGIYHLLNYSGRIENNTIQGFGNTYDQWYGILSFDIPSHSMPTVRCNSLVETGTGVYFNLQGTGTIFNDNTMDNNQFGLLLDDAAIGEQGSNTYASGNRWVNFTGGNFETFTMNGADPLNSILWIDDTDADQVPTLNQSDVFPNLIYDINDGLEPVSSNGNTTTCAAPTGLIIYGDNDPEEDQYFEKSGSMLTSSLEKWVSDSLVYGVYPKEQYIEAQHRAYRFMKMNNAWTSDASEKLTDFYVQSEAGNIGLLATVEGFLGEGKWQEAKIQLDEIKPENNIEENYKNYFLAYVNMKTGLFSTTDSLHINGLVHGCSKRDGEVVHHARVLHRVLYKDFETYFDNCPDVKAVKRLNNDISESNNLLVYPNPSTGEVWFKITNTSESPTNIAVYSLEGTLLHSEVPLNDKINFNFSSGIYFVEVNTLSESYREKVSIIK